MCGNKAHAGGAQGRKEKRVAVTEGVRYITHTKKRCTVPESMGGYVCTKELRARFERRLYDMGSTFYSSLHLKIKKFNTPLNYRGAVEEHTAFRL